MSIVSGVIVSVVVVILLTVAVAVILALLAVVLKQRKYIQMLTVAPLVYKSSNDIYEAAGGSTGRQNIELAVYNGKVNK